MMKACRRPRSMLCVLALLALLQGAAPACAARVIKGSHIARANAEYVNERPIIGILSQPGTPAPKGQSYIAASYVKWVEAAGARVVPILYDMTEAEVRERFSAINGVLLPGGGAELSPGHKFYDTAALLTDLAIEANERGDYFPVHGTCLGMETLSIIISKNYTLLQDTDAEDAAAPLLYTDAADKSYMLSSLPKHVKVNLQDQAIAMENHAHGITMAAYEENPRLKEFFEVLSLSLDKSGHAYISTMEARKYPITAVQWHPEKNAFEWTTALNIPHSPDAVEMSQEVANFFISEARNSKYAAKSVEQEDDMLIYNWKPRFTGLNQKAGGLEEDFEQAYFFDIHEERQRLIRQSRMRQQ